MSADVLFGELLYEIEQHIAAHPRSLQERIGPSEIGVPCARQLAYKLAGVPEVRPRVPAEQWLPTVGTAVHTWLEGALEAANARWVAEGHPPRYIVEGEVCVGQIGGIDITGHTDCYDTVSDTVVDWKVVGVTTLREVKAHGASQQYRAQAHLYGKGWAAKGYPVRNVLVVFLPRNGLTVNDAQMWSEPYDEQVALEALRRANRIFALMQVAPDAMTVTNIELYERGLDALNDGTGVGLTEWPQNLAIPTDAHDCRFCPWLQPGSAFPATSCPGDATRVAASQAKAAELSQTADVFG